MMIPKLRMNTQSLCSQLHKQGHFTIPPYIVCRSLCFSMKRTTLPIKNRLLIQASLHSSFLQFTLPWILRGRVRVGVRGYWPTQGHQIWTQIPLINLPTLVLKALPRASMDRSIQWFQASYYTRCDKSWYCNCKPFIEHSLNFIHKKPLAGCSPLSCSVP